MGRAGGPKGNVFPRGQQLPGKGHEQGVVLISDAGLGGMQVGQIQGKAASLRFGQIKFAGILSSLARGNKWFGSSFMK